MKLWLCTLVLGMIVVAGCVSPSSGAGDRSPTPGVATSAAPLLRWFPSTIPRNVLYLDAIDCTSSLSCVAVGTTNAKPMTGLIVRTTDGGETWEEVPLAGDVDIYELSDVRCSRVANSCIAVGTTRDVSAVVLVSGDGGARWEIRTLNKVDLARVSCIDTVTCMAVGAVDLKPAVFVTHDAGRSWAAALAPATGIFDNIDDISCTPDRTCSAIVRYRNLSAVVETTTDLGVSWTKTTLSGRVGVDIVEITCQIGRRCRVAGISSIALLKANKQVAEVDVASLTVHLNSIACPSDTVCVAAGEEIVLATSDGGLTWSAESLPPAAGIRDIACPDTAHCYTVGENGGVLRGVR